MAQLAEILRYKPESRGFDFRWCHNTSGRTMALGLTQPLTEMIISRISWGEGGRCVRLTNLPHSCADCLETWKLQPPGNLILCPDLYRICFTVILSLLIFLPSRSLFVHLQCLHHILL